MIKITGELCWRFWNSGLLLELHACQMVGADAIVVCHLVSAEISAAQGAASSFLMKDRHLGGGHFC